DAAILADLYNPKRAGMFAALLHGRKYDDLRFYLMPRGQGSDLGSEEVGLQVASGDSELLYMAHRAYEYTNGVAPTEDKRSVVGEDYKIATTIARNERLSGTAEIRFRALADGERVLAFGLMPYLRASSVRIASTAVPFIQEDAKQD